jgi:hypothetical protein
MGNHGVVMELPSLMAPMGVAAAGVVRTLDFCPRSAETILKDVLHGCVESVLIEKCDMLELDLGL